MNARTNKNGFTIIEVVLVLAIAALIFLMIFVALPALQRGQANTARKNDASTIASAINTYRTNKNGALPTSFTQLSSYVDATSQLDFSASGVTFATGADVDMGADNAALKANLDKVKIVTSAKCNSTGDATQDGSKRQAAVLTVLETAADKYTTFCQNA